MDVTDAIRVMEIEEEERTDEIVRDGKNVYLRIPLDPGFEAGYAFRMISCVQPSCLLPVGIVREGHQVFADYQISGWTALSSVPSEDLLNLLYGFVNALKEASDELTECLLSSDDLSLDPGHIFLRRETGEIRFVYLLEGTKPFGESLQGLMEYFIKTAKPSGEQEVLLLYGLYQKSREENVTPEVLASCRAELMGGPKNSPKARQTEDKSADVPWEGETRLSSERQGAGYLNGDEDAEEIYERLGMDPEDRESGFSRWKKEREAKTEKKAEEPKRARKEPESIPVKTIVDAKEKPQSFLRKHLPEILIGAAAVILAICALVL